MKRGKRAKGEENGKKVEERENDGERQVKVNIFSADNVKSQIQYYIKIFWLKIHVSDSSDTMTPSQVLTPRV